VLCLVWQENEMCYVWLPKKHRKKKKEKKRKFFFFLLSWFYHFKRKVLNVDMLLFGSI
jgi:hypothetical protein